MNSAFPDPSLPDTTVRFIEPYTSAPELPEVVWAEPHGMDYLILGEHKVPNSENPG